MRTLNLRKAKLTAGPHARIGRHICAEIVECSTLTRQTHTGSSLKLDVLCSLIQFLFIEKMITLGLASFRTSRRSKPKTRGSRSSTSKEKVIPYCRALYRVNYHSLPKHHATGLHSVLTTPSSNIWAGIEASTQSSITMLARYLYWLEWSVAVMPSNDFYNTYTI
jgi:hypothetical protein